MGIYEAVKRTVTVRQVAERYGLKISRSGMACCPFHEDRHPSLKLNEDYFYCFGCGAKGDVIDFTARLYGLSGYDAANKLNDDFGVSASCGRRLSAVDKLQQRNLLQCRADEAQCFHILTDYLQLLHKWRAEYAPKTPEDPLDERFVELHHVCVKISIYKHSHFPMPEMEWEFFIFILIFRCSCGRKVEDKNFVKAS